MIDCKLVLFDLDDTLYDFAHFWEIAVKETLRRSPSSAGLEIEPLFALFREKSDEAWKFYERMEITIAQYRNLRFIQTMAVYGREVSEEEASEFNRLFLQDATAFIEPTPSTVDLLTKLRARVPLGIVTNGPVDQQMKKVEKLGLTEIFPRETVFMSGEIGVHKPHPLIFEKALAYFGVAAEDAVFVGDSWKHDVAGAMDAGMRAIWLNGKGQEPATDHRPLAVAASIDELRPLFGL